MKFIDFFIKRKTSELGESFLKDDSLTRKKQYSENEEEDIIIKLPKRPNSLEQVIDILDEETRSFFPKTGYWTSACFSKSNEISYKYLPCHLRDNKWLARLMNENLQNKSININFADILIYINTSKLFQSKRHEYELEIVKWQLQYLRSGGEGWLMPEGTDELKLLVGTDQDIMFRDGVVKTLKAIGMDREVIEEGIEYYHNEWRDQYMNLAFRREYEPILYSYMEKGKKIPPVSEEFKSDWLTLRNYDYYQKHKSSVDKYGALTKGMDLTEDEAIDLRSKVFRQSLLRKKEIQESYNTEDDIMSTDD